MGINKLQPTAAEQRGVGVSGGEAGAAPQLCGALVGIPLPPHVKTFPYAPPLQNVALNPIVIPLLWKRFECDTCTIARGGGRGWDRGLVSSLDPLSCCLASVPPAASEQRVSSATLHGTRQQTATRDSRPRAGLCRRGLQPRGSTQPGAQPGAGEQDGSPATAGLG